MLETALQTVSMALFRALEPINHAPVAFRRSPRPRLASKRAGMLRTRVDLSASRHQSRTRIIGRCQIFVKPLGFTRWPAAKSNRQNLQYADTFRNNRCNNITNPHNITRLGHTFAVDAHFTTFDQVACKRARFDDPRMPKPFIKSLRLLSNRRQTPTPNLVAINSCHRAHLISAPTSIDPP